MPYYRSKRYSPRYTRKRAPMRRRIQYNNRKPMPYYKPMRSMRAYSRPAYRRRYYKDPIMKQAEDKHLLLNATRQAKANAEACENAAQAGVHADDITTSYENAQRMEAVAAAQIYANDIMSRPNKRPLLVDMDPTVNAD